MSALRRRPGRTQRRAVWLSLLLLAAVFLSGCHSKAEEAGTPYTVYYRDIAGTGLVSAVCREESSDQSELVSLLWERLTRVPEDSSYASVVPEGTNLLQTSINSGTLNLYFDRSVAEMSTVAQLLFRAGIVCTLTQIEGIGEVIAQSVRDYFDNSHNKALVDRLLQLWAIVSELCRSALEG